MGKKRHTKQSRQQQAVLLTARNNRSAQEAPPGSLGAPQGLNAGPPIEPARQPRVFFAVGDADDNYTEGKIWRLAQRLREQTGWEVIGVTNEQDTAQGGEKLGLPVQVIDINSPGVSGDERLWAASRLIHTTADLCIPGSELLLWKVLALDDFVGSMLLFGAQPSLSLDADLFILPLMSVDNNSKGACGLYTWMVAQARQKGIPVIGLEVSPLGNKTTLSHLPATHYAVKSAWARDFLIRRGLAQPSQVSVLRWEEAYLLWPGQDDYTEAYLEKETRARAILHTPADRFVIAITHHVNLLWEVREILAALAQVPGPLSVVIRVSHQTFRRQYRERDIVLKTYDKQLRALPHVVIDEQVGVGLLLQLADLVISPFAGITTERAAFCRKPTIICQSMGEEGWQGEFIYWEPNPKRLPALIQAWRAQGLLDRVLLARLAASVLGTPREVPGGQTGRKTADLVNGQYPHGSSL